MSFSAGQKLTAAALQNIIDPGWTSYTPAWTSTGTAPAIGNGTLSGRVRRSTDSDLVIVEIFWQGGSTTTFGTGSYRFSLPVTIHSSAVGIGSVYLLDVSTAERPAVSKPISTTTINMISNSGEVTATSPWTWGSGDVMQITHIYEPA